MFNVERYLPECLNSLRSLDFPDFEVVLVNDGSTDSSLTLCQEFKQDFAHPVVLLNQENKGLLGARRAGFAASHGKYIISLDSDDMLRQDALSIVNDAICCSGADVIFYGYSRSKEFSDPLYPPLEPSRFYKADEIRNIFCSTNRMNAMWFKAVARHCIGLEARFDAFGHLNMGEDAVQSALIYDCAESAVFVPEALYFYRSNDSSISLNIGRSYLDDMEKVHAYLESFAGKWDLGVSSGGLSSQLASRCVEEICHFALHYCDGRKFRDSREGLEAAACSHCLSLCASDPSGLSSYAPHTRLTARLLASGRLHSVWFISRLRYAIERLRGGR